MRATRTTRVLTSGLTAAVGVTLLAAPVAASGHTLLRSGFSGTLPLNHPVDPSPVIAGVNPGGAAWVLDENSRVRVREDGRITLVERGLVIPGRTPTGNPAALMAASLVCGGVVADSTDAFPMDPDGFGRTSDVIDVPDDCHDPTVLVRNATNPAGLGAYFAVATED